MSALGGKYELGERLGGGGMAEVFRAVIRGAEGFSRQVAIKRIKRSISTDRGFAELFVSEARLAAKLHHPNVVQTLDFDKDEEGCFYLVMELIDGVDLRTLVGSGRIPVSACCFVVSEFLRALDYAHELVEDGHPITIIHRDISPHNIMLSWQGAVKVVDFGIAKAIEGSLASRSGSLKGKVAYMSPEQVHGHSLDGRSDLFAAGIVLYELLTGTRLFVAKTEAATLSKVLTLPIANPRTINDLVPPDLDAIVMRLLQRDRANRYSRAREAMEDLLDCSVSTTKGRRDLETLLLERFPDKAPKRTSRLSNSPSPAASASFESSPAVSTGTTSSDGVGVAPTVLLDREGSSQKDTVPNRASSKPIPKRTLTAEPAIDPGAVNAAQVQVTANDVGPKSRIPLIAGVVAIVVVAIAVFALRGRGIEGADPGPAKPVESNAGDIALVREPADTSPGTLQPADVNVEARVPVVDADVSSQVVDADVSAMSAHKSEERHEEKAVLTLRVKPWATINVDGKNYGQTPQTIHLRRGKHRVSLENPGVGKSENFSLSLRPGQTKTVEKDWR